MSPSSKWIEGIKPDGGVCEAARLSLEARLKAVMHWLPLAADQADQDVEYVHRLRVATRRATAALKLYRGWLPKRPYKRLKKRLREIRRAAGEARDLDVLAERLHRELGDRASGLLAQIATERAAAQPDIVEVATRCGEQDRLARKVYRLLAGIGPRGENGEEKEATFRDWAHGRLGKIAAKSFAALPADSHDPAALHKFRIQIKALRYAIELLASAFGPEMREVHYPVVELLQDRLGRVNDHVTGGARLRKWGEATSDTQQQALLDELVEQEHTRMQEEIAAFRLWWTPERVAELRSGLAGSV